MMKVKYYKCPICSNTKFKTLNGWGSHVNTQHPEEIPKDYSIARYFYYTVTGKTHGICRTCKGETPWNENSWKYDQYCTNPECKKAYVKIAKGRMVDKYGKEHILDDPDHQRKMVAGRRISGNYKFQDGVSFGYVGSYEKEFLKMLDTMMQWHSNDIIAPSPHTYYYDYENPKDDKSNWGRKFYIPDFYIPSLNLEIEIKQSTSTNREFIDIVRVKEQLKDEMMYSNKKVNYLKLMDNDFTKFFEFLMKAKENIPTEKELQTNTFEKVNEALTLITKVSEAPKVLKTWGVVDHFDIYNACVKVEGYDKPFRGRSEILIIKGDKVFISFRKLSPRGKYDLPGGGWDPNENHMDSAIREAKEEVRMNVTDVKPAGAYVEYSDVPARWVMANIPKKDWWYGYYTEVYIGNYSSKYDGFINEHDKDQMINTGKWYKIKDIYKKLLPVHQKAIDEFCGIGVMEGYNDYDIAQEGLFSFIFGENNNSNNIEVKSWNSLLFQSKNIFGSVRPSSQQASSKSAIMVGVKLVNGYIEIRGINYTTLSERIKDFYIDKSINNIFIPTYNALSYKRFERKKIQRKDIKIDYVSTPEFFALELVKLFVELGHRYNDRVYRRVADKIYEMSWLSKADATSEQTPLLNTSNLQNIAFTLNDYQKEFIEKYPKLKAQLNLNGYILAFEQGLGKTLTAVSLAECLDVDHVYIVCPNSLKENWALEIKKYYRKYSNDKLWNREVFICNGRFGTFNQKTTKFIITNNESIDKMFPYVMDGKNMLILDESHNFRNLKSQRTQQLISLRDQLKCVDTLVMSGTPIKAAPNEIVPALMLIDPLFTMESAEIFTKAFKLKETLGTSLVQNRFGKIMYRKDKTVLNQLPPKNIMDFPVSIRDAQKYILVNVKEVVNARYAEIYNDGEVEMMKLKEPFFKFADCHKPSLEDKLRFHELVAISVREDAESLHEIDKLFMEDYIAKAKAKIKDQEGLKYFDFLLKNYLRYNQHCRGLALGEILPKYRKEMFIQMYEENKQIFHKSIIENTKKTLIFSQFKDVVKHLYYDLNDTDIGTVMITGDVKNRLEILREFKENDSIRVLVATSQTIGTGVTLIEANQMYFFGPPWRAADFDQCSDRIHRIGQTDDTSIPFFIFLPIPS